MMLNKKLIARIGAGILLVSLVVPTLITNAASTGKVTFDAVLDTVISTVIGSTRQLTASENQEVKFRIIRDFGIRTEVTINNAVLNQAYDLPVNANTLAGGLTRDEYMIQWITKPTVSDYMTLATFKIAENDNKTVTLHFVKRNYGSLDTTPGQPGIIAGDSSSVATATFGSLIYDVSDVTAKITNIFPLSIGNKKFIGAIESSGGGKNILIFEATNPYKPTLLKKNIITTSFDISGAEGSFNVRTVSNYDYFVAGRGIFKFDTSGNVTLVKIDKEGGYIELLFRGANGKIYASGSTEKIYIDGSKNPLRLSVAWYDFSKPENGFVEVSGYTDSLNNFPLGNGDSVQGPLPNPSFEWGVIHSGSKVIAVVPILQNIHAKHTGAYWIDFIDITDIVHPNLILSRRIDNIGNHEWNLTAAEKFYLSYTDGSLFVDDANKKLFDIYEAKTTNLAAGVAATVSPKDEEIARAGLRRRAVAASYSVVLSGSSLSFAQLSRSILCERIGSGNYVSEVVRNLCSGADNSLIRGVGGVATDVENGLGLFLVRGIGARLGFFGSGENGFSWITGSDLALMGYKNQLKSPEYQGGTNSCYSAFRYGVSQSDSIRCIDGFIQQIDSKNFVVYLHGTKHINTAKVVFNQSVPMGSSDGIITNPPVGGGGTAITPSATPGLRVFSIDSLIKLFSRIRQKIQ